MNYDDKEVAPKKYEAKGVRTWSQGSRRVVIKKHKGQYRMDHRRSTARNRL